MTTSGNKFVCAACRGPAHFVAKCPTILEGNVAGYGLNENVAFCFNCEPGIAESINSEQQCMPFGVWGIVNRQLVYRSDHKFGQPVRFDRVACQLCGIQHNSNREPYCVECMRNKGTADAVVKAVVEHGKQLQAKQLQEEKPAKRLTNREPEKMPETIVDTLKTDATDAAWRTAGSQFTKLARDPVVALLQRHLAPDDPAFRARLAVFLDTELGSAIMSAVLSAGLTALPKTAGPIPERLARELRVRAMSGVGDALADVLMGPLREVACLYLSGAAPTAAPETPRELNASARMPLNVAPSVRRTTE